MSGPVIVSSLWNIHFKELNNWLFKTHLDYILQWPDHLCSSWEARRTHREKVLEAAHLTSFHLLQPSTWIIIISAINVGIDFNVSNNLIFSWVAIFTYTQEIPLPASCFFLANLGTVHTLWPARCQWDASPDQCSFTSFFKLVNLFPRFIRNLTNSGNWRRVSLLPGRVFSMIFYARAEFWVWHPWRTLVVLAHKKLPSLWRPHQNRWLNAETSRANGWRMTITRRLDLLLTIRSWV